MRKNVRIQYWDSEIFLNTTIPRSCIFKLFTDVKKTCISKVLFADNTEEFRFGTTDLSESVTAVSPTAVDADALRNRTLIGAPLNGVNACISARLAKHRFRNL